MNHSRVRLEVGKAMRDNPQFRLHKNRKKLVLFVMNQAPEASIESITRAQRKLWEQGLYLPEDPDDLVEWHEARKKGTKEYKEVYGR